MSTELNLTGKLVLAERLLDEAEAELRRQRDRAQELARVNYPQLKEDEFRAFLKEPYVLIQKRGHEWFCVVPRWVDFSVGWLERATDSYNIFLINRYTLWLGDVPEVLREQTGLEAPPGDLAVMGGKLVYGKGDKPIAERYKEFLSGFGPGVGHVKRGREFDLLASLIDDGYLPFVPRPVDERDRRAPQVTFTFEGKRAFQAEAYQKFLELGAVGVYWMTGAGKSFFAMTALDSLKGRKLIVVPTKTLVEQWRQYLETYAPQLWREYCEHPYPNGTVEIITYSAYEAVARGDFTAVLFDECHRLPANSFSRLATLKTKYRIGLSASPYREDNRTNYIIALTGYPLGQDWRSMVKLLGKDFHIVNVWIVTSPEAKLKKIDELLTASTKTIIFADSIDFGAQIAARFKLPHIHGGTSKRIEQAASARAFVASRVMDMGVSIHDLEHVIEADFLFGSRQQELQRTGRLFHAEEHKRARHDIIMTREEFDNHGKRLHGLVEKGFKVNVHQ